MTIPNRPLVTIAIPTYNGADQYLADTLECALAQTYENLEIIVSDNGSTDNTTELVESYGDDRIRYVRHDPGLGPNGNFNYCVEAAKGEYTLVLHDDDLIDDDYVEVCIDRAGGSTEHSFIRTGIRIIDFEGNVLREKRNEVDEKTPLGLYQAWFAGKTEIYYASSLFNTKALREAGGFDAPYNQLDDGYAVVRLAPRRDWIDVEEPKACFRKSPGQLTYSVPVADWCGDFSELLDIMCEQVKDDVDVDAFRAEGMRFFGILAKTRANARATRLERLRTGLIVARHFGPQYFPWGRFGKFVRPLLGGRG